MTATRSRQRALGLRGVVLVLAGAVLLIVSFRFLDWYSVTAHAADRADRITFGTLHGNADQLSGAGAARAYFDWLAWVLLILLVAAGVAANLPFGPADPARVVGFLLGLLGVAATYFAAAQLRNAQEAAGAAEHSVFYNSTWGMWAAFAGFAVSAVGSGLGSRRR